MADSNLDGTLPESIGAFVNITVISVFGNKITGTLPLSLNAWRKVNHFQVQGNQLSGGPLPTLPFQNFGRNGTYPCALFTNLTAPTNQFTCPWPAGAVAACTTGYPNPYVPITNADCSKYSCDTATFQCVESRHGTLSAGVCIDSCGPCTGNSTKLPPAQCKAWIAFYNATNGDQWTGNGAACTRTDPCSCQPGGGPNYPVCDVNGMTVKNM
jgi:hypothetical protein